MSGKICQRLELLLFSVGGVRFGVDAGQIAGVNNYKGEQADDLFWFHKELEYQVAEPPYTSPVIASVRTANNASYRIIIDKMDDIAEFSQSDIMLFPAHLERFFLDRGLWGVLPGNQAMVLLVDFQLLLKQKCNRKD